MFSDDFVTIYHGDAWELAPTLAPQSIHTIVTSPPYWGLRDYGEPGQFGLEPTPDEYVARLVELFALLRPALRDDGTVWLNLGDSYANNNPGQGGASPKQDRNAGSRFDSVKLSHGLKAKDLVGIPWRVAFALQADGWYLRSDIIWHKPNPMPESVTDRPTKAHEYVFLLSKKARYHYDNIAIAEDAQYAEQHANKATSWGTNRKHPNKANVEKYAHTGDNHTCTEGGKRNKRTVWTIPTRPFSAAHFAVFPPDLIKPCILAGAPEKCCPECGAPWERVVEKESHYDHTTTAAGKSKDGPYAAQTGDGAGTHDIRHGVLTTTTTKGFVPTCNCGHEPIGGTVLDPFMGSGTTAQVARSLGRKAVGFELNAEYINIAAKHRLAQGVLL